VTYNVLGGVGWVWGLLWTGYLLGQTVPDIGRHVHIVIGVVVLLSVLPIGLEYWKARRRRRAALAAER
jgi:membrane-associated protein